MVWVMMVQQNKIASDNLILVIDSLLAHIQTTSELASEIVEIIQSENTSLRNRKIDLLNEAMSVFVRAITALHSKYKAFEH